MKRSEMVEIIQEELAGHLNYSTMPIIVASELLAKLEDSGMAPPEIETDLYDRSNCCNYMEHEWEDENEDPS